MAIQNKAIKHQHKASDKTLRIHRETWGREMTKGNEWKKTDGKQCKLWWRRYKTPMKEIREKRKKKSGIKITVKAYQIWDNSDRDREKLNKNRKEWICMKWVFFMFLCSRWFSDRVWNIKQLKSNTKQHNKVCISPVLRTKDVSVLKFTFSIRLFWSVKNHLVNSISFFLCWFWGIISGLNIR